MKLVQHPGETRYATFRNRHKDGSWRWVEATATNLLNESAVQGLIINMHDITERKQAEVEIQRRIADLEVLYENGLSISVLLEPQKIARILIDILSQKLDWHHAIIRLYHPDTKSLELLAINGPGLDSAETEKEIERIKGKFSSPDQGSVAGFSLMGKLSVVVMSKLIVAIFRPSRTSIQAYMFH